jgi:hypothetical protein
MNVVFVCMLVWLILSKLCIHGVSGFKELLLAGSAEGKRKKHAYEQEDYRYMIHDY